MTMQHLQHSFRTHERAVWLTAWRVLGDPAEAEDIVQDAFLRAMSRTFDRPDEMRGWLVTVARNLARDRLRRRKVRRRPIPPDIVPDVEALCRVGENRAAIFAWLGRIPPTQRLVVVLRDLLDHTPAETARVLGLTPDSVRTLHLRARKALSAAVEDAAGDPEPAVRHLLDWLLVGGVTGLPVRPDADPGGEADPVTAWSGILQAFEEIMDIAVEVAAEHAGLRGRALLARGMARARLGRLAEAGEDLAAAASALEPGPAHGQALVRLSWVLGMQGEPERARITALAGLPMLADPQAQAALRIPLASLCRILGRTTEAAEHLAAAVTGSEGSPRIRAVLALEQGVLLVIAGRPQEAERSLLEALRSAETAGDARLAGQASSNLAVATRSSGDLAASRRWATEAVERGRALGDRGIEANGRQHLAAAALMAGDARTSVAEARAAMALHEALGVPPAAALDRLLVGMALHLAGDAAAADWIAAATEVFDRSWKSIAPLAHAHLAAARATAGDREASLATARELRGALEPDPSDEAVFTVLGAVVDLRLQRCDAEAAAAILAAADVAQFSDLRIPVLLLAGALAR